MRCSNWKIMFKWDSIAPSDLSQPSTLVRILVSKLNIESSWTNSATLKNPLFIWRCIAGSICVFVLFMYLLFLLPIVGGKFFLPYTNINFILLTVYFVCAVIFSLREYKFQKQYDLGIGSRGNSSINIIESPLVNELGDFLDDDEAENGGGWARRKRFYLTWPMKMFWVLFELCFTNALFLDIVFWGLLFPAKPDWSNPFSYFVHFTNLILVFVELLLNSLTFIPAHFLFELVFVLCYTVVVFSWYGVSHSWLYPFLDATKYTAIFVYPGLLIFSIICFSCGYGLVKLRDRRKGESQYLHVETL